MNALEKRVEAIEERNKRVDSNKAWETSWTRRLTIAAMTYAVVLIYLFIINNDSPYLNALVPATGYLLSTLVLRKVRKIWEDDNK